MKHFLGIPTIKRVSKRVKWPVFAAILLIYACASPPPPPSRPAPPPPARPAVQPTSPAAVPQAPQRDLSRPVRTVPADKPVWVGDQGGLDTPEEKFFVGKSPGKYTGESEAENAARENARSQVMQFYGESLQAAAFEKPVAGLAGLLGKETEIQGYAQAAVSQAGTDNRYTEVYLNEKNQEEYVVYLLYGLSRMEAAENADRFTANVSKLYTDKLSQQQVLRDALVMYDSILAGLGQNSLHRAIAFYEEPDGKKSLYLYLADKIKSLADGLAFEEHPVVTIQKTDVLNTQLKVTSKTIENIGAIDTMISIYSMETSAPVESYTVPAGAGNIFSLQIPTQKYAPGRYGVNAELLLKEAANQAKRITDNITASFSFEVTPVNTVLEFTGEYLTAGEQDVFTGCLREVIEKKSLPVRIVSEHGGEQNLYTISVTVNIGILPPIAPVNTRENAFWDVSLSFLNNGKILNQTERKRITEPRTDFNKIFHQAADHIRNSDTFFQGINTLVTQ
jgi:hypothetical protein